MPSIGMNGTNMASGADIPALAELHRQMVGTGDLDNDEKTDALCLTGRQEAHEIA